MPGIGKPLRNPIAPYAWLYLPLFRAYGLFFLVLVRTLLMPSGRNSAPPSFRQTGKRTGSCGKGGAGLKDTHSGLIRILWFTGPLSRLHALGLAVPMRLEERLQAALDMPSYGLMTTEERALCPISMGKIWDRTPTVAREEMHHTWPSLGRAL